MYATETNPALPAHMTGCHPFVAVPFSFTTIPSGSTVIIVPLLLAVARQLTPSPPVPVIFPSPDVPGVGVDVAVLAGVAVFTVVAVTAGVDVFTGVDVLIAVGDGVAVAATVGDGVTIVRYWDETKPARPKQVTGCQPLAALPVRTTVDPSAITPMTAALELAEARQFTPAPPVPVTFPVRVEGVLVGEIVAVGGFAGVAVRIAVGDGGGDGTTVVVGLIVGVGTIVAVRTGVRVGEGMGLTVLVIVGDGIAVGTSVRTGSGVGEGPKVGTSVTVGVGEGFGVSVGAGVDVGCGVDVEVGVGTGVGVEVGDGRIVGVGSGVDVGNAVGTG